MQLKRKTLYDELKHRLLRHIEQNRPKLLPGERDLIKEYGVSRNTVRRAVQELTNEGVLRPVQGLGTLVYPRAEIGEDSTILVLTGKKRAAFSDEAFGLLMDKLDEFGLNSIMVSLDHDNLAVSIPRLKRLLAKIKVDGVIFDFHVSYSKEIHELISESGRNCVCLRWRPKLYEENFVADDLEKGFHEVAKHLLDLGHRRIALLGMFDGHDIQRTEGVRAAFAEAKAEPCWNLHLEGGGTRHVGYMAADSLLASKTPFTATLCQNDEMALGVMERLTLAGLRVPEDVSITGYDNIADAACYPVALTSCGVDTMEMVNAAVTMLLKDKGCGDSPKVGVLVKPQLVIRDSTGRPRQ